MRYAILVIPIIVTNKGNINLFTNYFNMENALKAYYDGLPSSCSPKTQFIRKVIEKTGVTDATVRMWIFGRFRPTKESHRKAIAEITGIDEEVLFPDK